MTACSNEIRRTDGVDPDDGRGGCCIRRIDGEPVAGGITLRLAVPSSDLFDTTDVSHNRRAWAGATASRGWFAVSQGGTLQVFSMEHNGSRANPVTLGGQSATDLAGATNNFVTLPAGARTSAQNATTIIAALSGAGITGAATDGTDADGNTIIAIPNVTNYRLGPTVNTIDTELRGMWGFQRNNWGGGVTANTAGGSGGTLSMYLGNPGASLGRTVRILGIYMWGHTNFAPRVAVSSGPAFTTAATTFTILSEGVMSPIADMNMLIFTDPVEVSSSTELWVHWRSNGAGGPMFRNHGLTPVGRGDLGLGQACVFDTTVSSSAATPFGATYNNTVDTIFNIYMGFGIIFEVQDASGYYPGDARVLTRVGDQNDDDEHGTQFAAGPAQLTNETTHHRFDMFQMTGLYMTEMRRAVDAIQLTGNVEDSTFVVYGPWTSLAFPAAPAPARIAAPGPMNISTQNAYNTFTFASRIAVGTDVLGANAVVSDGFNYVTDSGAALATYTLGVFLDSFSGSGSWLNAWEDDGRNWHDYVPGASERVPVSGIIEYRTNGPPSTMPYQQPTDVWPDPFATDATDDSPPAIALDTYTLYKPGFSEAA